MSNWNYVREETERKPLAGDHRFEVMNAYETTAKTSGNRMIVVELKPNGLSFTVKDYFVEGDYFNRKMTSWFDSTNIEENNFNFVTWVGAVGAARFKEDENGYLKVGYYLNKKQQAKLPPWQGEMPERQTVTEIGDTFKEEAFDDIPF